MSKLASRLKLTKKVTQVFNSSKFKIVIPAGLASASPPLGPLLGQVRINMLMPNEKQNAYSINVLNKLIIKLKLYFNLYIQNSSSVKLKYLKIVKSFL
jgi:ribosomal protein L11